MRMSGSLRIDLARQSPCKELDPAQDLKGSVSIIVDGASNRIDIQDYKICSTCE